MPHQFVSFTYAPCTSSPSHLVAEDLDLSKGPVDGSAAAAVVAVGVDLDNQRHPLHALLRGEVRAQTVHRDEHLREQANKKKDGGKGQFLGQQTSSGRDVRQTVPEQ